MGIEKEHYLIGEVSKICNIPIKTLRYYDEIGVLKPEKVDRENNYRYYSKQQILQANIIKDLKMLGFSLQDIKSLLKREDLLLLKEKLENKMKETEDAIKNLKYTENKLKHYYKIVNEGMDILEQYNDAGNNSAQKYNIELKRIAPFPVAYTRYRCPCNPGAFIERYSQLCSLVEKYGLHRSGPFMALYYDHYTVFDYEDADIEVCVPVIENRDDCNIIRKFGDFMAATTQHAGRYTGLIEGYRALVKWMDENGYEQWGAAAERYIIDAASTSYEENYVTELIIPVQKTDHDK